MKIYLFDAYHMTKMADKLCNILPRNQWSDSEKLVYVSPGTQAQ